MRKIKLTKDAVDGLLDNLLKRSPNNYGQYTEAVSYTHLTLPTIA